MASPRRDLLILLARGFSAHAEPGLTWDRPPAAGDKLRPGDDYNARADWRDVLLPAGWEIARESGGVIYWRRPGKADHGWSATTGRCGELLYVFSSSAPPFVAERSYSRFAAYALLNHAGDYKAAARALAGQGYGTPPEQRACERNGHAAVLEPAPWEPPIPLTELPEGDDFPLDVFPLPLRRFLNEVAMAKHAPVDYAAVPLLVIAGGAIGSSRALTIKQGWSERPALYAAIVAPPGSAKTPALKDVASPVYAEQARLRAVYQDTKDTDPKARLKTIYVSDITTEALASLLQENDRGVVMIRDELTAWAASMDQYKAQGRGSDRQVYLNAWSGEPISVHRKMQQSGPIFVGHPFVGIVGGLPPAGLARLCGDQGRVDDGFLDRILFCFPDTQPAFPEDWQCVGDAAVHDWCATLDRLWRLEGESIPSGGRRPRYVRLTHCGRLAWVRFTAKLAAQMNAEDFPDLLRGPWSKMRGYGARLALVVHCLRLACDESVSEDVDGDSMERAGELVAYFQSHARKVYAAFDADPEVAQCKRVLRWIGRKGVTEFKARDAQMDLAGGVIRSAEDLERYLARLVRHGYLRKRSVERQGSTGRLPGPFFEVNPSFRYTLATIPSFPTKPVAQAETGQQGQPPVGNEGIVGRG